MKIQIQTTKEVLVDAMTGYKSKVKAILTERLTTDKYLVIGKYVTVPEIEGDNEIEIGRIRKELSNEQVDAIYSQLKGTIQSTAFTGIYDELSIGALKLTVGSSAVWGLTINDWEEC